MVVLAHVDKSWRPLVKLAERHPGVQLILAHALLHEFRELAYLSMRFEVAKKRGGKVPANVFADVSGLVTYYADSPMRDEVAWQLRKLGVDRLVFGSDFPVFTPAETRAALSHYGLTPSELRAILVETPLRLFPKTPR